MIIKLAFTKWTVTSKCSECVTTDFKRTSMQRLLDFGSLVNFSATGKSAEKPEKAKRFL